MKNPFLLFEFFDEQRDKQPKVFMDPITVLQAKTISEIPDIFRKIEKAVDNGKYVAGYVSYEAAPAFDSNMSVCQNPVLPLVWFGVFNKPSSIPKGWKKEGSYEVSEWKLLTTSTDYKNGVDRIKKAIEEGDTYQVNYTDRFYADFHGDDFTFYRQLTRNQQSNYSAYLNIGKISILSASPELFFSVQDNKVKAKPMKGTAPRGRFQEEDEKNLNNLLTSEKEQAENLMIVDLLRNDLSRIAQPGSVKVTSLFHAEKYPTVHQLTSTIEAEVKDNSTLFDWFQALFPCGSITGAPKISTMQHISELEKTPREVYCGAIGYMTPERKAVFNVPIRTVIIDQEKRTASYGVGGGITWDSTAEGEYKELFAKAKLLKERIPDFQLLESLKLIDGKFPLLNYHLNRLQNSATYFDYAIDINKVKQELYNCAVDYPENMYKVRLLVDRSGKISIDAAPGKVLRQEVSCVLAEKAVNMQDPFLFHKTTHREIYDMQEKFKQEGDFSVLMWNEREELTEFTIGNLVLEQDGKFFTPPLTSGLLPGTFREYLINHQIIEEKVLYKHQLEEADAIWFINSIRGWLKVIIK